MIKDFQNERMSEVALKLCVITFGGEGAKLHTELAPLKDVVFEDNFNGNKLNILHFIRGYVDGDGCLSYYKHGNSIKTEVNLVGTKDFLESVKQLFGNQYGHI